MSEEEFEMWFDGYLWSIYTFTVNTIAEMNNYYGAKRKKEWEP